MRSFLRRVDPRLDEHVWRVQRWDEVRRQGRHLRPQTESLRGNGLSTSPIHVVVIPHLGPEAVSYRIAGQNHFFEIAQSLREILGDDAVTVMSVQTDEASAEWHRRLLETLSQTHATHLVTQIETDPNKPGEWSWDVVADSLEGNWQGDWIGVMWDAAFPWLTLRARRLGQIFERLLIVDLCQPMTGTVNKRRVEAGPTTMPLSKATVDAILASTATTTKKYEVSFIGALYDYRVELLDTLASQGISVITNPHRSDSPTNYDESRANQPSFLEYMRGLSASETTINFSLASGGPIQQYKIRIQEAAMVGCLPVTDDRDRTRHFFSPNEYGFFANVHELGQTLDELLSDRQRLRERQDAARSRALQIATVDFWGRVGDVARVRGLRPITPLAAPATPG